MVNQRRLLLAIFISALFSPASAVPPHSSTPFSTHLFLEQTLSAAAVPFQWSFSVRARIPTLRMAAKQGREIVFSPQSLPLPDQLAQMHWLRSEVLKEMKTAGQSALPKVVVVSDQHGASAKFDALVLDAIRSVLPVQLAERLKNFVPNLRDPLHEQYGKAGIYFDRLIKNRLFIFNLGDLMDRGPNGIAVYLRSKQLIDAGISSLIVGNHCLWMAMNLWGIHLPTYMGYAFYGYQDKWGDVAAFHHRMITRQDELRLPEWWAEKLAVFTEYHRRRQKEHWSPLDIRVNGELDEKGKRVTGTGLYSQVSSSLKTDHQKKIWNRFRGNMFKSEIYTGVRAVGEMSVGWWEELQSDFESEYHALTHESGFHADSPAAEAWREAIGIIRSVLPQVRQDLETHVENGEWWWRIFEALNRQNYRSPEWWAKDWLFHEGWGSSVLKELNKLFPGQSPVTVSNYFQHPVFRKLALFFRNNFNLTDQDPYFNRLAHAFLPVNEDGDFYFRYRPVGSSSEILYQGAHVWKGLETLASDIRNPAYSIVQIHPALALINSWYADETTQAKAPDIARVMNQFRGGVLADRNGFSRFANGHVPFYEFFKKLTEEQRGLITGAFSDGRVIFTDHGMSEKFEDRGAMVVFDGSGAYLRGWPSKAAPLEAIQNNPPTANGTLDDPQILFHNKPIKRMDFLTRLLSDLENHIIRLGKIMRYREQNPLAPLSLRGQA